MPTIHTATLADLYRHGDFSVTESHHQTVIDMTVRRSGCSLYGTGDTLELALSDIWNELEEHLDAVDHLEDLGVNVANLGLLTDGGARPDSRYDSDIYSLPPTTTFPDPVNVAAASPVVSNETINTTSPGYVLALLIPVREGRA